MKIPRIDYFKNCATIKHIKIKINFKNKNMGKRCDVCKRSSTKGVSRSHSNIKTLKRQGINLQTKNIMGIKAKVCVKCLRTMKKNEEEK